MNPAPCRSYRRTHQQPRNLEEMGQVPKVSRDSAANVADMGPAEDPPEAPPSGGHAAAALRSAALRAASRRYAPHGRSVTVGSAPSYTTLVNVNPARSPGSASY